MNRRMDWPIREGWTCETCGAEHGRIGEPPLVWGIVNGACECSQCRTPYMMRDGGEILAEPRSMVRPESKAIFRRGWLLYGTPFTSWTEHQWKIATD